MLAWIRRLLQGKITRVTYHHEGAGTPTNNVQRFSEGGYSYGNGQTIWQRFRSPFVSWGTLGFNHRSLDICISGNRMVYEVTDAEVQHTREICADSRARGELVDDPEVVFHHDSPGSNTVCPGFWTYHRQPALVAACKAVPDPGPLPTPTPAPIGAEMAVYTDEVHPEERPTEPGGCTVDPANNIILTRRRMTKVGDAQEAPSVVIDGERVIPSNMGDGWRARGSRPRINAQGQCAGCQLWFYIPGQGLKTRDYEFDAP